MNSPMIALLREHVYTFARHGDHRCTICSCGYTVPITTLTGDIKLSWASHLWDVIESAPELDSTSRLPASSPASPQAPAPESR